MRDTAQDPFDELRLADPELAARMAERLRRKPVAPGPELVAELAAESLWALGIEVSFGRAVAEGLAELAGEVTPDRLDAFRARVRAAARTGPTQGRTLAECLPAVLRHGDEQVVSGFFKAWQVMGRKGSYVLLEPLRALGRLLAAGDHDSARVYVDLLHAAFQLDLGYEPCRFFSVELPKAALGLAPGRRPGQLAELSRLIRVDPGLAEPFLKALGRGLTLLSAQALDDFISEAIAKFRRNPEFGTRFLALESRSGQERFGALQVSVGFGQVQDRLRRYLHARTGLALAIRPLSALPEARAALAGPGRMVCSDDQAIYVPDEIGRFASREENAALYTLLVRLEASLHEFGTIDFDCEKALERCRGIFAGAGPPEGGFGSGGSSLERFLGFFPDPELAADLFTVFELGRIRKCLERDYPGLVRRYYPRLIQAFRRGPGGLDGIFAAVALGDPAGPLDAPAAAMAAAFDAVVSAESPVEAVAELTARVLISGASGRDPAPDAGGLQCPFGWRPWPNPALAGNGPAERLAERIRAALAERGLKAYAADIRRRLASGSGTLEPRDIRALCRAESLPAGVAEAVLKQAEVESAPAADDRAGESGALFRYPEWDLRLGDYLPEHVRLREVEAAAPAGTFYTDVLRHRRGLVSHTRRAFERLRPEGLKRLRRWPDGDEFDYRGLLEAAVDRRLGKVPSERLFIKRVKDRREVAVLLLVDVSRSTANLVPGTASSVLDIEKEAIVVLCEALSVLGDSLAVAGFSGSGRLGVEYVRIKGFDECMSDDIKLRIGALRPRRNTRMGAAIRHAARELGAASARVRLLMILSDGFPNDTDYKGAHAAADSRQALLELGARRIRFHALTVNLPAEPKLDELYGKARHHVIADVRDLPGGMLRVYSALTR